MLAFAGFVSFAWESGERMNDLCICVLAHNEQKHIAATIKALAAESAQLGCDIKVYANGCTDATVDIVRELMRTIPRLFLRELDMASKPNAWNAAFRENIHTVLFFSDGDVLPEIGAIEALYKLFASDQPEILLAGCSFWPRRNGLTLEQRFAGFMQIPLHQDFLSGQLYGIRRDGFSAEFHNKGIMGLPLGIVAEDMFLQYLTPPGRFTIIPSKVFYEPPSLSDYWKYLARMRWQDEQLALMFADLFAAKVQETQSCVGKLAEKMRGTQEPARLLLGLVAVGMRCVMKWIFRSRIIQYYRTLGPVSKEGRTILSEASRAISAK